MKTIHLLEKTDKDGTLSLRIPLAQPDSEFEVVVVVQPKAAAHGISTSTAADPWARADAIRQRLAASGRTFSDSAELIREDRDR